MDETSYDCTVELLITRGRSRFFFEEVMLGGNLCFLDTQQSHIIEEAAGKTLLASGKCTIRMLVKRSTREARERTLLEISIMFL
jgi:hypothetical protein